MLLLLPLLLLLLHLVVLLLLLVMLLLLLLGVKLNPTVRSMPVSVLVPMMAVLIILVAVQLAWQGEVGLTRVGLQLTRVAGL